MYKNIWNSSQISQKPKVADLQDIWTRWTNTILKVVRRRAWAGFTDKLRRPAYKDSHSRQNLSEIHLFSIEA